MRGVPLLGILRTMRARTVTALLVAGATCVSVAPALAGRAHSAAAAPPPTQGVWRIESLHNSLAPPKAEFHGSFRVSGRRVTDFHGVTAHGVIAGCTVGEQVTVLGSVPITHTKNKAFGEDFWGVRTTSSFDFVRVAVALRGPGAAGKAARTVGELRMYFPGGTQTSVDGYTEYSNLTFGPSAAGYCNLQFTIAG